jgi:WD40 repeat protein
LAGPFGVEIRDAKTLDLRKDVEYDEETISADSHPSDHSFIFLSRSGTVEEWNLADNTHRYYRHELPEEDIKDDKWTGSVAYSPDGTRIVCYWGGVDAILVWSNKDCSQPPMKIQTPAMNFKTFSFISDGIHIDALFSTTDDVALVKRWNVDSGEEVNSLEIKSEEITTAVFSKNNAVLITGHLNKICVWNLDGNCITQSNSITGDWGNVTAIDATQAGDIIASGGDDAVIRLWDASSLAPLASYPSHTRYSLRFSPQGDRLASISLDKTLRVWDTSKEAFHLKSSSHPLENVTFSPNGEYVAASSGKDIFLWDGRKGTYLTTFTGHSQVIKSLAFVKHLSLLASFSSADGVFLWDVERRWTQPKTLEKSQTIGSHDTLNIVVNPLGYNIAVVFGDSSNENAQHQYSFKARIWYVPMYWTDSTEIGYETGCRMRCEGLRPHFIQFAELKSLAVVRYFQPRYESKITILGLCSDTLEECDYNEAIHLASNPAYFVEASWIVSKRTGKRLLWLPENRRPIPGEYTVYGNIIAVGSKTGELSLLDMSYLETQR